MSTFVPLAADSDGTLSAVTLGDWLLQVIKLKRPDQMELYCSEFVTQFGLDKTTGEQHVKNAMSLFHMFLNFYECVFDYLYEAKEKQEIIAVVTVTPSDATANTITTEVRKTYMEIKKEVEEYFTVLMSMIPLRCENSELAGDAAGKLCKVFSNSNQLPEFRLKLIQTLYNVFPPDFPYRFQIFSAALDYAAKTNQFSVMLPYIDYINEWIKDWNASADSKRQLFLVLANQLKYLGNIDKSYYYLKRHVESFQGEPTEILQQIGTISAAVELGELSISLPDEMYFDELLHLDAVNFLRNTEHSKLVDLLEIFMKGGPNDLKRMYENNAAVFKEHGLDYKECCKKIELLSLVSLASVKSDLDLSYISKCLNISNEEAEELTVRAIGQELIDAKIDQMNQIVHVRSTMQREFKRNQWEMLHSRLETWIDGVKSLLNALNQAKQVQSFNAHDNRKERKDRERDRQVKIDRSDRNVDRADKGERINNASKKDHFREREFDSNLQQSIYANGF